MSRLGFPSARLGVSSQSGFGITRRPVLPPGTSLWFYNALFTPLRAVLKGSTSKDSLSVGGFQLFQRVKATVCRPRPSSCRAAQVQMAVNPNTSVSQLSLLARDDNFTVRVLAAAHPNLSSADQVLLAADPVDVVSNATVSRLDVTSQAALVYCQARLSRLETDPEEFPPNLFLTDLLSSQLSYETRVLLPYILSGAETIPDFLIQRLPAKFLVARRQFDLLAGPTASVSQKQLVGGLGEQFLGTVLELRLLATDVDSH